MEILRYTAFSADPDGGNPAGVVLDATDATDAQMLAVAAELGYSESAFLVPRGGGEFDVRYFSPLAEVDFCGHATIASAVAYAQRNGPGKLLFHTVPGPVAVETEVTDGVVTAALTSVPPSVAPLEESIVDELLTALRWQRADLDPALPVKVAFGGAHHPIVAAATRERLAALDYDFAALAELMARHGWTTVDLVWRESPTVFHSRNPFPPGGIVEDPATGAAAAAFGGYLRATGLVEPPVTVTVHQGHDLGRPGTLTVGVPAGTGGIRVAGTGVAIS